jgi:NitT/TauT family transport system permease protein
VVFSLISAVVIEFVAASKGLGYLIVQSTTVLDTPRVFAVVCVLAAIGIGGAAVVRSLRRRIVFWEPAEKENSVREATAL